MEDQIVAIVKESMMAFFCWIMITKTGEKLDKIADKLEALNVRISKFGSSNTVADRWDGNA